MPVRDPLTRSQAQSLPPSVPNPISLQSELLSESSLVEPDGSVMIEQPVSLPEDLFLSKSTSPDECQLITHSAEGEHQVLVHSDARQYANNDYTDLWRLPKLLFPPANSKEWLKIDNELRDELRQHITQHNLHNKPVDFILKKITSYVYWYFERNQPDNPNSYKPTNKHNFKHTNKHSGKGGFNNLKSKMRELRKQLRKNAQESLEITKPLRHEYHNTRKHFLRQHKLEDLRIMQQKE